MTDEIVYENGDEATNSFGKTAGDKVATLKQQLEEALAQKQEYLDGWQRSKADYINLKKRAEEEKKRAEEEHRKQVQAEEEKKKLAEAERQKQAEEQQKELETLKKKSQPAAAEKKAGK